MPRPARVVEHAARERDHVGLPLRQDVFGLLRFGDQPDRNGGHADLALDRFCERHLVVRPHGDLLLRRHAAAGHVDEFTATRFQRLRKHQGLFQVPDALHPIGG
ncbi:hypothetical protein G6F63_016268 [Rhizopus arrhizus]|nr:hypothetical protein G6F63_016268 [Rhizopus arrhizus]